MEKDFGIHFVLICLLMFTSTCFATDTLYVTTSDGYLLAIEGMVSGTHARGSAGDQTIGEVDPNSIPDGMDGGWTCVAVGPHLGGGLLNSVKVIAGRDKAFVWLYNKDLTAVLAGGGISNVFNEVRDVAIGDLGDQKAMIFAAHAIRAFDGGPATSSSLLGWTNGFDFIAGAGPGPHLIQGFSIADVDASISGNEIIYGALSDISMAPDNSDIGLVRWNGSVPSTYWQQGGGTYPKNMISHVLTGDLYPGENADEWVMIGNRNDITDPSVASTIGNGSHAFSWDGTPSGVSKWTHDPNTGNPAHNVVAGVVADVYDGFAAGDGGLEVITVGANSLYIVDGNPALGSAATLKTIDLGEPMSSVIVADVLGDDDVDEIVVGTPSGKLLAYEHATPTDLSTDFLLAATLLLDPEGDGTEYLVTDITALPADFCVSPSDADLNGDCTVNYGDFSIVSDTWGDDSRTVIPDPNGFVLLAENRTGSGPFMHVQMQAHDEPSLVDYVKVWKESDGTVLLEDHFNGNNGDPPDPTKWAATPASAGTAMLNGAGQAVLSNAGFVGSPWQNLLFHAEDAGPVIWDRTDEPVWLEMHLILPPGTGTDQQNFGFGNGFDSFYIRDDDRIMTIGPEGQQSTGGFDTGVDAIRDGSTILKFRIRQHVNPAPPGEPGHGGVLRDYYAAQVAAPPCSPPAGDLSGNCVVDEEDLEMLAEDWLLSDISFSLDSWVKLVGNIGGGSPNTRIQFAAHDEPTLVDLVRVTTPAGGVVFEDTFDGAAGTAPNPALWVAPSGGINGGTGGTAALNGLGQVVLTNDVNGPGGPWENLLYSQPGATTWSAADEPTVEIHMIAPVGSGTDQQQFGFGDGFQSFYVRDGTEGAVDGSLWIHWANANIRFDTLANVIRDGVTVQKFRITRHPSGATTYEVMGLDYSRLQP